MLALLLADSRLPVGSHAHSGGIEQAVDEGSVHDLASLEAFLTGRLSSAGTIEAHAASRACALFVEHPSNVGERISDLDAELDARIPSPAARATSRAQGASFLPVATRVLGSSELARIAAATRRDPHLPIAIGFAAGAARLSRADAASIACYHGISGCASAALRLLGLDPVDVATCVARMTVIAQELVVTAATTTGNLPASSSPLLDFLLERHDQRTERLFAS
jgi:urease accessory protein